MYFGIAFTALSLGATSYLFPGSLAVRALTVFFLVGMLVAIDVEEYLSQRDDARVESWDALRDRRESDRKRRADKREESLGKREDRVQDREHRVDDQADRPAGDEC
jgi:hypothetical protein